MWSFIKLASTAQRAIRNYRTLVDKALQPNKDVSEDFDGIPQDWSIGPPVKPNFVTTDDRYFIDGLIIIYIDGVTIYDYSTRSDRMETRSDFSGLGAVTDRHGCKHKFPENKWSGPPR